MINRVFSTLLIVLTLTVVSPAQVKVAVIDLKHAFEEYYKTKDDEVLLRDQYASTQKAFQELKASYQKTVEEATKLRDAANDKTLSQSGREEKQKAFATAAQDADSQAGKIQEFQRAHEAEFQDRTHRLRQIAIDDINKAVSELSAKERYSLVFDKSDMNGTSPLMYSQDVNDITDEVIKRINASKPPDKPSASGTGH